MLPTRVYRDVLGLKETGIGKGGRIAFFSAGVHHHDVSCEVARAPGPGPQPKGVPGLYHIAFAVGDSPEDLQAVRRWMEAHGLTPFGETETSFSVRDPAVTRSSCTSTDRRRSYFSGPSEMLLTKLR